MKNFSSILFLFFPVLMISHDGDTRNTATDGINSISEIESKKLFDNSIRLQKNLGNQYYVSNSGSDTDPGTESAPLKTVAKGLSLLSTAKLSLENRGKIILRKGIYPSFTNNLDYIDFINYPGEKVIISGAQDLDFASIEIPPKSVIDKVVDASLRNRVRRVAIDTASFGTKRYWTFGDTNLGPYGIPQGDFSINGQRYDYAVYPLEGQSPDRDDFLRISSVQSEGYRGRYEGGQNLNGAGGTFTYSEEAIDEIEMDENVHVEGFLQETYAFSSIPVASSDDGKNQISLQKGSWYGIGSKDRFRLTNVLEYLEEGKMAVDHVNGYLYFVAPVGFSRSDTIEITTTTDDLVLNTGDDVSFTGLHIKGTRGNGMVSTGTNNVAIDKCHFSNISSGGLKMSLDKVYGNELTRSTFKGIGTKPIVMGGGDRLKQTPSKVNIVDVLIDDFGYKGPSGSRFSGVSVRLDKVTFQNSKFGAMQFHGNNIHGENLKFKNLCGWTIDFGAVYSGFDPTSSNNYFKSVYAENIGNDLGGTGNQVFFIDDFEGHVTVDGIISNIGHSGVGDATVKTNRGKHVVVKNSISWGDRLFYIIDAKQAQWDAYYKEGRTRKFLDAIGYPDPDGPFAEQHPVAYSMIENPVQEPSTSNVVKNNLIFEGGELVWGIINGAYGDPLPLKINNKTIDRDPGFADPDNGDFTIEQNVWENQFPDVPWIDFGEIGYSGDVSDGYIEKVK